jgi:Protein of unknown function (DUF3567)
MKQLNSARNAPHAAATLDMEMIYDSDAFCVVRIDLPHTQLPGAATDTAQADHLRHARRGGYEIVDKFGRKEIFLEGFMAASFKDSVDKLIESQPTQEEIDDYLDGFSALMQQPLVAH